MNFRPPATIYPMIVEQSISRSNTHNFSGRPAAHLSALQGGGKKSSWSASWL